MKAREVHGGIRGGRGAVGTAGPTHDTRLQAWGCGRSRAAPGLDTRSGGGVMAVTGQQTGSPYRREPSSRQS